MEVKEMIGNRYELKRNEKEIKEVEKEKTITNKKKAGINMNFNYNWDNFPINDYTNDREKLIDLCNCFLSSIEIGEIKIEVTVLDYSDNADGTKVGWTFDLFVANEDTGYGYTKNFAYDYAGYITCYDLSLTYEEFVKKVERLLTNFIKTNDKKKNYSLIEKANKPLISWH